MDRRGEEGFNQRRRGKRHLVTRNGIGKYLITNLNMDIIVQIRREIRIAILSKMK